MLKLLIPVVAALVATACSDVQLVRLAPPGIIKYEDIAGDKPPNPAIQTIIDERKETAKPRFPKLAETPSLADLPAKRSVAEVDEAIDELEARRAVLEENLAADRAAVEAERQSVEPLIADADTLTEQVDRDEKAAKRERNQ